jgi:hypothetical protein
MTAEQKRHCEHVTGTGCNRNTKSVIKHEPQGRKGLGRRRESWRHRRKTQQAARFNASVKWNVTALAYIVLVLDIKQEVTFFASSVWDVHTRDICNTWSNKKIATCIWVPWHGFSFGPLDACNCCINCMWRRKLCRIQCSVAEVKEGEVPG